MTAALPDCQRAMILAAGRGTRLRPLTDHMPKALVPVGGKPLVALQMERLQSAGFTDITINVHHFADMLCDYISHHTPQGLQVAVSSEREQLLDTGGALKHARPLLLRGDYDGRILVHNVDILSNAPLRVFVDSDNGKADALLMVSRRQSSRQLYFDKKTMRLVGWKNLKTGDTRSPLANFCPDDYAGFVFSGIHAIGRRALEQMDAWPDVFSIIDFYLKESGRLNIKGVEVPDLRLLDVGKTDTLAEADAFLNDLRDGAKNSEDK